MRNKKFETRLYLNRNFENYDNKLEKYFKHCLCLFLQVPLPAPGLCPRLPRRVALPAHRPAALPPAAAARRLSPPHCSLEGCAGAVHRRRQGNFWQFFDIFTLN